MSSCTEIRHLITWVASGAAEPEEVRRLEEHTASCAACRAEWASLRTLVAATQRREDPGAAYWATYEDRLRQRMQPAARPTMVVLRPSLYWAAAIVLIGLGVLLGRSSMFAPGALVPESGSASAQLTALDERTFEFLERSRTVLLAVANFTPGEDVPEDLDLDRRRLIAGQLVSESADLQSALTAAEQQRLSQLISDLELILLQLANLDAEVDIPQLEMLQHGVNQKAILFKIDVESMGRPTPGAVSDPNASSRPDRTTI